MSARCRAGLIVVVFVAADLQFYDHVVCIGVACCCMRACLVCITRPGARAYFACACVLALLVGVAAYIARMQSLRWGRQLDGRMIRRICSRAWCMSYVSRAEDEPLEAA